MKIFRELHEGLVVRSAEPQDTAALVDLQIHAFANPDTNEPDIYLGGWTRDLMGGKHPIFKPQDFLVVEDTKTRALVSCVCWLSQTWSMDGVAFGVGRPEIVCTDAAYRKRGLVREQFQVLHEWSRQRGELVQAITGIPFFYRQFGYEYAIDLPPPRQTFVPQQIPELKAGVQEKFRLRRAREEELTFIADMYAQGARRSLLHCERNVEMFRYEQYFECDALSGNLTWWDIIETTHGERAGILAHRRYVHQGRNTANCFELLPQFDWDKVAPDVLRVLAREAPAYASYDNKPLTKLYWFLEEQHPFFQVMKESTAPLFDAYAWYVRVPDLRAFLKHIAPVLEKRLAASAFALYTGALRLHFYPHGVEMIFENGKVSEVHAWHATTNDFGQSGFGNAAFPDLTFLKLLFGYRNRAELQFIFPDVLTDGDKTNALLDVLFPKRATNILPMH